MNDFKLLDAYCTAFREQSFANDMTDESERSLIYATPENLKRLQEAKSWTINGTFKIVPTVFRHLGSIHALASGNANLRIVPLVYALMTKKSEDLYQRLFREVNELAEENDFELKSEFAL